MVDYKKMYTTLFNQVTDIIDQLQEAQKQTELMYIESPECQILELIRVGGTNIIDVIKADAQ